MQIEYEDPQSFAEPSVRLAVAEAEPSPEPEEEEEDDEEGEAAAEQTDPKQKKKRIIKQRQSLAEKQPGTTIFPISRVKRIIKADKELDMMTSEASFMVAVATEYFIKQFMEEGYTKARLDKRRIVNYKDMAAVVARSEEFDFLRDVIPSTIPISEALELRKQKMVADDNPTLHEDAQRLPSEAPDDLPPLIPSTNPLFPNAIVKKPPNTHAKSSQSKMSQGSEKKAPSTPKVVLGKNAPSTPRTLMTRESARKSVSGMDLDAPETEGEGEMGMSLSIGMGEQRDGEVVGSSVGMGGGEGERGLGIMERSSEVIAVSVGMGEGGAAGEAEGAGAGRGIVRMEED